MSFLNFQPYETLYLDMLQLQAAIFLWRNSQTCRKIWETTSKHCQYSIISYHLQFGIVYKELSTLICRASYVSVVRRHISSNSAAFGQNDAVAVFGGVENYF